MAQYRKKPIVISAEQLLEGQPTPEGVNFGVPPEFSYVDGIPASGLDNRHWVHTLEGPLIAQFGDWIITGIKGERYPCKPDVFAATYDLVVDYNGSPATSR